MIHKIRQDIEKYNDIWSKYNDKYFETLSTYLNIKWPNKHKIIYAEVGITPVFPRYLDSFRFSLGVGLPEEILIRISAHETLHFLWFHKWKELYPECPRREYDSPFITWEYSEMVTDPILNSKEIKEILKIDEKAYNSFYEVKDGNNYMMDELKKIYDSKLNIEEKIIKGFEYIKSVISNHKRKNR